jgi:hypothetical protein
VLFGPYGAGPAVAACRATDALIWNHGGATDRLQWPVFSHVINVLSPASTYFAGVLDALHATDADLRTISLLHSTTGFGREVAAGTLQAAARHGLALHAASFQPGAVRAVLPQVERADVLLVGGSFEDERTAARVLLERPWRAAAFVSAGVDDVLTDLASAGEGLLGPCQWLASVAEVPEIGPDGPWFVHAYHSRMGEHPPYPAAAAFAAGVLATHCLQLAGSAADQAVLATATALRVRTLFGPFALDARTGAQVGHQILVTQWQDGVRQPVWPLDRATRRLRLHSR